MQGDQKNKNEEGAVEWKKKDDKEHEKENEEKKEGVEQEEETEEAVNIILIVAGHGQYNSEQLPFIPDFGGGTKVDFYWYGPEGATLGGEYNLRVIRGDERPWDVDGVTRELKEHYLVSSAKSENDRRHGAFQERERQRENPNDMFVVVQTSKAVPLTGILKDLIKVKKLVGKHINVHWCACRSPIGKSSTLQIVYNKDQKRREAIPTAVGAVTTLYEIVDPKNIHMITDSSSAGSGYIVTTGLDPKPMYKDPAVVGQSFKKAEGYLGLSSNPLGNEFLEFIKFLPDNINRLIGQLREKITGVSNAADAKRKMHNLYKELLEKLKIQPAKQGEFQKKFFDTLLGELANEKNKNFDVMLEKVGDAIQQLAKKNSDSRSELLLANSDGKLHSPLLEFGRGVVGTLPSQSTPSSLSMARVNQANAAENTQAQSEYISSHQFENLFVACDSSELARPLLPSSTPSAASNEDLVVFKTSSFHRSAMMRKKEEANATEENTDLKAWLVKIRGGPCASNSSYGECESAVMGIAAATGKDASQVWQAIKKDSDNSTNMEIIKSKIETMKKSYINSDQVVQPPGFY